MDRTSFHCSHPRTHNRSDSSMGKQTTSALPLPSSAVNYWREASRPLVSMAFVAPMLVVYESGLLLLGPQAMRNGADVWLRSWLETAGFGQYFLLPVLTCGILLAWHHIKRQRWHVDMVVLWGMLVESLALGFLLLVLARLQVAFLVSLDGPWQTAALPGAGTIGQIVAFFGAGIYEELLFRLMLLPALAGLFRSCGNTRMTSLAFAAVLSSLLFAAAHYRFDFAIGPFQWATAMGEAFDWTSFLFRFSAGGFFSLLFIFRGFGISAGAHALYDILVSLM